MLTQEFINIHERLNDKEVKKHGEYAEEFVWIEHVVGDNKINFLGLYDKVIGRNLLGDVILDEKIGFIFSNDMYISKEFLERLQNKGIHEYLDICNEWDIMIEELQENNS